MTQPLQKCQSQVMRLDFRDPYDKKEVEAVLSKFIGQKIEAVYFVYPSELEYDYAPISNSDVQEAFLYGAEIEMYSGETLCVSGKRYYSNYFGGFEGIELAIKPFYQPSNYKTDFFQTKPWQKYRDKAIERFSLYELATEIQAKFAVPIGEVIVPYGFSLEFSNGSKLFTLFMGLADYHAAKGIYEDVYFCEDVHFIFNTEFVERHELHQNMSNVMTVHEER